VFLIRGYKIFLFMGTEGIIRGYRGFLFCGLDIEGSYSGGT
jgi:hypothetical protein